ncbi:MAG TPA: OB-fold nucleic acid binding domain-containing protein, partial [Desulfohalobiaceae bacterium]|nr:OB-fold nucleic acid binding domain-containing protein [Desulfohalobiaceae bacterium]
MKRTQVIDALQSCSELEHILVQGWVRTKRISKKVSFLEVNDGSCLSNIQVIVDHGPETDPILDKLATGASVSVKGSLVQSPGKEQKWEIQAKELDLLGKADQEDYPLQKKRHSDEFLRT